MLRTPKARHLKETFSREGPLTCAQVNALRQTAPHLLFPGGTMTPRNRLIPIMANT